MHTESELTAINSKIKKSYSQTPMKCIIPNVFFDRVENEAVKLAINIAKEIIKYFFIFMKHPTLCRNGFFPTFSCVIYLKFKQ